MGDRRLGALSENQVIYHCGGRRGSQSFNAVFNPLRDSAHSVVEPNGMVFSEQKSIVPRFEKNGFEWSGYP